MLLIQPDIRPVAESKDLYELHEAYLFEIDGKTMLVPKGFRHDGATAAALLFQRDGIHRAAALVHDYLYSIKGNLHGFKFSRRMVDRKFKEMLIDAGVKSWHVWVAYIAVRLVGGFYWK